MSDPIFRQGRAEDSSDLALLLDAASRRLSSWFWSMSAAPGQSWFEAGRERIRTREGAAPYHRNWTVAESDGQLAGGFYGFALPDPPEDLDLEAQPAPYRPMIEMEQTARGCWLLQVVALMPEHRGKGLGKALIEKACDKARGLGHRKIVLQVESANSGAIAAYLRCGFTEWERRPFVPFPGSDDEGDWVLMVRGL